MSEATSNVEFAHRVHEHGHHHGPSDRRATWVGVAEAVVLSIVAVATAWSGYQAAKWDALSAKQYALVALTTVMSQEKATLAGQDCLFDIVTFNGWIGARTAGNDKLAAIYQRRFRPEYAAAFAAWQKLDPFNNPSAPPGPIFMPEYANTKAGESAKLSQEARAHLEQRVSTRETGDSYVKVTVFFGDSVTSDGAQPARRSRRAASRSNSGRVPAAPRVGQLCGLPLSDTYRLLRFGDRRSEHRYAVLQEGVTTRWSGMPESWQSYCHRSHCCLGRGQKPAL